MITVTVTRCIRRAEEAGLSGPLPAPLDDAQLKRRFLPGAVSMPGETRFPVPEWGRVHRELRRKGVTLALLWEEYKAVHAQTMQYSRFCQLYRAWAAKPKPSPRGAPADAGRASTENGDVRRGHGVGGAAVNAW